MEPPSTDGKPSSTSYNPEYATNPAYATKLRLVRVWPPGPSDTDHVVLGPTWSSILNQVNAANDARHAVLAFERDTRQLIDRIQTQRDNAIVFDQETKRMMADAEATYRTVAKETSDAIHMCADEVARAKRIACEASCDLDEFFKVARRDADAAVKAIITDAQDELGAVYGLWKLQLSGRVMSGGRLHGCNK